MTKEELLIENARLKAEIAELQKYKDIYREMYFAPPKNERGAGRKPVADNVKEEIIQHRDDGMTIRAIAESMNLSVGLVQKVCNRAELNESRS